MTSNKTVYSADNLINLNYILQPFSDLWNIKHFIYGTLTSKQNSQKKCPAHQFRKAYRALFK